MKDEPVLLYSNLKSFTFVGEMMNVQPPAPLWLRAYSGPPNCAPESAIGLGNRFCLVGGVLIDAISPEELVPRTLVIVHAEIFFLSSVCKSNRSAVIIRRLSGRIECTGQIGRRIKFHHVLAHRGDGKVWIVFEYVAGNCRPRVGIVQLNLKVTVIPVDITA